jgi:hypothetical protein
MAGPTEEAKEAKQKAEERKEAMAKKREEEKK